jgi:hypothetical protein
VQYIARHSVDNALKRPERLDAAIADSGSTPMGFPIDAAAADRTGQPVRKMVFEKTYLVYYTIDELNHVVQVAGFRHGARLPKRGEP